MRPENRQDFRVIETHRTDGKKVWQVRVGGTEVVTTCNTKENADHYAKNLNLDPWFLDRGQTRADRNSVT